MRDSRFYSATIVVTVLLFGVSFTESAENGSTSDTHPEGVDSDENYWIKVTRGQEVINSTLTKGGHYRSITLTLSAFNATFVLDLHLNTYLFAVGYVERSFNKDGIKYHHVNHTRDHCYYLGQVRDQAQSSAAVSTCKGIVGYFVVGNVSYHIDPAGNDLHGPHKVYRYRGDGKKVYRCGYEHSSFGSLNNTTNYLHNRRRKRFIWPQDRVKKNKVVEIYVANDNSQYISQGSDVNRVTQRAKDIVNIASAGYQPLGIYLVLIGMEIWTESDKIYVNAANSSTTLKEWSDYRAVQVNPIHYNDNGILISRKSFDEGGRTLGLAFVGTMCSNTQSSVIMTDPSSLVSSAASIMDHELGHSFGLLHDDVITPCPCSAPNNKCVMNVSSDVTMPTFIWSQCSLDQLAYSFQHGLDICLYNVPQTIYPNNVLCGNGIVEAGEQCDCGNSTNQECNKACCDHNTCQLVSPATCAYGKCCNVNTCQILPCGTSCLGKNDASCDLEEFCDGINYLCPNDTHLPDGASCTVNNTAAYCYNGLCRSHESQCQLLWGPETLVSANKCYSYNVRGDYASNCGIDQWVPNATFVPCSTSDAMCGTLQCQVSKDVLYYYLIFYYTTGYGGNLCKSVVFDFGLDTQNPGYVPSGAACGTEKMCVNQQCVDISSLKTTSCTSSCQASQVCNNMGQCQSTDGTCPQSTTATSMTVQTSTAITQISTTTANILSMSTHISSTNTQIPSANTHIPSTSTHISSTSTHIPRTSTYIPSTSTHISSTSTHISSTSTHIPSTSTYIPRTSTYIPSIITHIPSSSTYIQSTSTPNPSTISESPITGVASTSTAAPSASTPSSGTSGPSPSTGTSTPSTSTPAPSTTTQSPNTGTLSQSTDTLAPSTHTSSTSSLTPSTSTTTSTSNGVTGTGTGNPNTTGPNSFTPQTLAIILGTTLGALALAMAAFLLYTCIVNRIPVAPIAGLESTTVQPPLESVFTRDALSPTQTELQRFPGERFNSPPPTNPQTKNQQPDWNLLERGGQPFGKGNQLYPTAFYPYSSRYV